MAMQKFLVEMVSLENYGAHNGDGKASSGNAHWKLKAGLCYAIEASSRGNAMAYAMAKYGENNLSGKVFPGSVKLLEHHIDLWEFELEHSKRALEELRARVEAGDEQADFDIPEQEQTVEGCKYHLNMDERYPYWVDGGVAA